MIIELNENGITAKLNRNVASVITGPGGVEFR